MDLLLRLDFKDWLWLQWLLLIIVSLLLPPIIVIWILLHFRRRLFFLRWFFPCHACVNRDYSFIASRFRFVYDHLFSILTHYAFTGLSWLLLRSNCLLLLFNLNRLLNWLRSGWRACLLLLLRSSCDLNLKIWCIELIELCLVLHQLYLKVLVCLIMIGNKVIYRFEQWSQWFAVVFFLQQEVLLRKYWNEVHHSITCLTTELFRIRSNVWQYSNNRFIDWLQKSRTVVDEFVHTQENEISIGCASTCDFWNIQFYLEVIDCIKVHC